MDGIELRHLRYFLAVAEELHFHRAADRLYISQPALSEQIARLERSLGFRLFDRNPRGVQLTRAGSIYLKEAKKILFQLDAGVRRARSAAGVETPVLRVSFREWANATRIPAVLRQFRRRHPEVKVEHYELSSLAGIEAVKRGELDVGFVWFPGLEGLATELVAREHFIAVMPDTGEKEFGAPMPLAALADKRILWPARRFNPAAYDYLVERCHSAGFSPRIVESDGPQIYSFATTMELVAAEHLISFVFESRTHDTPPRGVVFRRIAAPAPCAEVTVAWRRGDVTRPLAQFLEVVREVRDGGRDGPAV